MEVFQISNKLGNNIAMIVHIYKWTEAMINGENDGSRWDGA